jgi:hypothetical protein
MRDEIASREFLNFSRTVLSADFTLKICTRKEAQVPTRLRTENRVHARLESRDGSLFNKHVGLQEAMPNNKR